MSEPKKTEMSLQAFVQSEGLRSEISKVMPKNVTAERIARIAWTSIVRNPALAACERNSLATAIIQCAQAGLEPDGRLAHLVPFGTKVQVIFDYKGSVTLAKRNGVDVKAMLVFTADKFQYLEDDGTGKTVVLHSFDPLKPRGEIIGVYSRALENGKPADYEVMSIDEVESIRSRSRAKDSGPWKTDYPEMVKKTVIKRHSKRWDLGGADVNAEDDTPPPLATVSTSRPIFEKPQVAEAPPNGGHEPVPEAAPPVSAPAPEPTPPPTEGGMNYIKAVRGMCKQAKLSEQRLLWWANFTGLADVAESLEDLALKEPEALKMISERWAAIVQACSELEGGPR